MITRLYVFLWSLFGSTPNPVYEKENSLISPLQALLLLVKDEHQILRSGAPSSALWITILKVALPRL